MISDNNNKLCKNKTMGSINLNYLMSSLMIELVKLKTFLNNSFIKKKQPIYYFYRLYFPILTDSSFFGLL